MKITFHGAAREVTGSKHLITLKNGKQLLLDCGMFQGMGEETEILNAHWGFDPATIDYLILSHAHIDHSGLIPKLVKDGFTGTIFCSDATFALSNLMLPDSADIQENEAARDNKYRSADNKLIKEALYVLEDVEKALEQFRVVPTNEKIVIDENISFIFTETGHIIGSCAVHLTIEENGMSKKISFSGDVGRFKDMILAAPDPFPHQSDVIILESTYGDSLHADEYITPELLLAWIDKTCVYKKGKLIIPAFSIGRTQEILYAFNNLHEMGKWPSGIPVFLDSPLSIEVTEVTKDFPQYFNKHVKQVIKEDSDPFTFPGLVFTKSVEESKKINYYPYPCVIISASGMGDAGRIKHHISNNIENSKNSILFMGYCSPETLGGRLLKEPTPEEINIFGVPHQVNAEIGKINSMSAHGDYRDLMQFISGQQNAEKLFLVHGEFDVQEKFKNRLVKKGYPEVFIPALHESFFI